MTDRELYNQIAVLMKVALKKQRYSVAAGLRLAKNTLVEECKGEWLADVAKMITDEAKKG